MVYEAIAGADELKPTIWKNCYSQHWAGILIPPAFAHPAKISLALVKKIFAHALEHGWIQKGDTCVDPFAGIGGVAFGAMANGIDFIGQELEPHFVDLANGMDCTDEKLCPTCTARSQQPAPENLSLFDEPKRPHRFEGNLEYWKRKFGLSSAVIVQGDSRKLLENLRGRVECVVSSPPYADSIRGNGNGIDFSKIKDGGTNRTAAREAIGTGYGGSSAQLAAMPEGCFDIAVSSPPFGGSESHTGGVPDYVKAKGNGFPTGVGYGLADGQLGQSTGETFWSAAREIVQQCFLVLKPGGHAIWVLKDFLRDGKRIEFCEQWRLLCEKVGFKTVCIHRAMLTTEIYGQHTIDGVIEKKTRKRSSFFRNLVETKTKAKIYWENVSNDEKKKWVERVRTKLSKRDENYILQRARLEAYKAAGSPDIELDSIIDWEIVLCMVKPAQTFERLFIDGRNGAAKLKKETVELCEK